MRKSVKLAELAEIRRNGGTVDYDPRPVIVEGADDRHSALVQAVADLRSDLSQRRDGIDLTPVIEAVNRLTQAVGIRPSYVLTVTGRDSQRGFIKEARIIPEGDHHGEI